MFDYKQDIGLLHGSLLSAASAKSGCLFLCEDIKDAVNIVFKSVKNIIHYKLNGIKEGKEAIKQQIHSNERLHAAVFFTTLRSHGIISSSADTFYNSIVYSWPAVDLRFYVELTFKSDWSEYFIKSAVQLPPEVLYRVLHAILEISFSNHIKYYSWHLILQTLILKLLEVPFANEKGYPFDFDFATETTITKNQAGGNTKTDEISDGDSLHNKPDVICLKEMFVNLINCISVSLDGSNDEDIIKILFHAIKTLLKSLITESQRDFKNVSRFVDFLKIYRLLKDYLLTDSNKGILKAAFQNCSCTVVHHAYATTSWNICLNYLTILLDYYSSEVCSTSYSQIKGTSELVFIEMVDTPLYTIIKSLDSPFLSVPSPKLDQRLKMLYKIIQFEFPSSSVAAKIILQSDSSLIEANDTIVVLEENSHVVDFEHQYQLIVDSIKTAKSQESKLKLLKLLYKLLLENEIKNYDRVLNYILCQYGLTTEFQLPDFADNFSQFTRKTPTLEEAEKILPALLVQNPLNVLKYLIDQALVQGSEGKVFIQLLQHFQKSCLYSRNFSMPILHNILNQYFEKAKLETYESKNMVTLYTFLVAVPFETPVVFISSFLRCLFIPKLQPDNDRIGLILECVNVLIHALLHNGMEPNTALSLISIFGNIIDYSIKTGNGKLKSLVTPMLKELEIHAQERELFTDKEKEDLWSLDIQNLNETVCVYVKEFLPAYIEFPSRSFIWTWYCKTESTYLFEENFSCNTLTYSDLLNTLFEVLPHLTKEEWLYSFQLMKICCRNHVLRNKILHSFNFPFQLSDAELDTYAVISCIISSLHFIFHDKDCDALYISSCFSNGLINLLNREETVKTPMLINIFLDVCYLIDCVSSDTGQIFTATLLELKKHIIDSCSVKKYVKDCNMLITNAVLCLPNSPIKSVLFQKLCT